MREIKFRLRDKDNKVIGYESWNEELSCWQYEWTKEFSGETTCPLCRRPHRDWQFLNAIKYKDQYTGFKDKNNKEIYEGDIVRLEAYPWSKIGGIYNVEFDDSGFKPFSEVDDKFGYPPAGIWCEILGNIYENPELLKAGGCDE